MSSPKFTIAPGVDTSQIPPTDYAGAGAAAAAGIDASGVLRKWAALIAAAMVEGGLGFLQGLAAQLAEAAKAVEQGGTPAVSAITSIIDSLLSIGLGLITTAQGEGTVGFYQLVTAMMDDLLGVAVTGPGGTSGPQAQALITHMQSIGGTMFSTLVKEFAPDGTLSPQQGALAIQAFLGFMAAFTVREANTAALSGPLQKITGINFRDYARDFAENMGLGRLSRQAFRPLMDAMVRAPAGWYFNGQFRPKRYAEADLLRLWRKKQITQEDCTTQLQQLGYRDADIAVLFAELIHEPTVQELVDLVAVTFLSITDAQGQLVSQGWTQQEAAVAIQGEITRRVNAQSREILHWLYSAVINGYITIQDAIGIPTVVSSGVSGQPGPPVTTVGGIVGTLQITDQEKIAIANMLQTIMAYPNRQLTRTELEAMWKDGIIDLVDLQAGYGRLGYSVQSVQWMTLQLLVTTGKKVAAAKTKDLTLAVLKNAVETGQITLSDWQGWLSKEGYTSDQIAVLQGQLTLPAPTPPAGG